MSEEKELTFEGISAGCYIYRGRLELQFMGMDFKKTEQELTRLFAFKKVTVMIKFSEKAEGDG